MTTTDILTDMVLVKTEKTATIRAPVEPPISPVAITG